MIYICEYTQFLQPELLWRIASELPLTFPEGWQNGRKWEKARQRILVWLLLAYGVAQEAAVLEQQYSEVSENFAAIFRQLEIRRTPQGKPYSATMPHLFFNLSHCDTACACIIGDVPVGIDVERKFLYKEKLERGFGHKNEQAVLQKLTMYERQQQQQLLWSLKESIVKQDGRGLGYGMRELDLSAFLPLETGIQRQQILLKDRNFGLQEEKQNFQNAEQPLARDYLIQLQAEEQYTLAACVPGYFENLFYDESIMKIRRVTEAELAAWIK